MRLSSALVLGAEVDFGMMQFVRDLRLTMIALFGIGCFGLSAKSAAAHDGIPLPPHELMRLWDWESWWMVALLSIAWLYSRGVRILWWRSGVGQGITFRQALAFNGGLMILFIAFVSPLNALSMDLFTAHMVQHLLVILLAAPLLLLGRAPVALAWAIPKEIQRWCGYWWRQQSDLHLMGRLFLQPHISWGVYLATLWLWQAPYVYKVALHDDLIHLVQHGVFLTTAMLFWRLLLLPNTAEPLLPSLRLRFVATLALTSVLLGTLLLLTPPHWYPVYLPTAEQWGLTVLVDQRLTGIVLLASMGLVYCSLTAVCWRAWRQQGMAATPRQSTDLSSSTVQEPSNIG